MSNVVFDFPAAAVLIMAGMVILTLFRKHLSGGYLVLWFSVSCMLAYLLGYVKP